MQLILPAPTGLSLLIPRGTSKGPSGVQSEPRAVFNDEDVYN